MERQSGRLAGDLAVEHGVGGAAVLGERHAHGGVLGQDHDAGVVAREAELAGRAVHAPRDLAAQLALLDLDAARELGAHERRHDVVSLVEVLGAADDLQRLGLAVLAQVEAAHVDHGDPHVVGIGMGGLGDDLGRHDVVERLPHGVDRLDLGAGADELRRELLGALGHVDQIFKPGIRNAHGMQILSRSDSSRWAAGRPVRSGG